MGFWRKALGLDLNPPEVDPDSAPAFDAEQIGGADIDPAVFGLQGYAAPVAPAARVDRRTAMQVPAVKRSHDLIAGTLGGLPLNLIRPDKTTDPAYSLFAQPERNVPRSVTMTRLFADLFFDGQKRPAWWKVTEFTWDNWPLYVKRVAPHRVTVDEDREEVRVDGKLVDQKLMIRFDAPTEGILTAGARAIRTCALLDSFAANAAQGIPPIDYFTPADDLDPFDSADADDEDDDRDEVRAFLDQWAEARRTRTTAYIPYGVKYNVGGFDPKTLQLAEQRNHAVLEIARLCGVDPEELGVSTTSRTYANQFDRRKAFIDMTLGPYMKAVEDRLSLGDVCPRGYAARFDLDDFLRSDAKSRYEAYKLGRDAGALTEDEVRDAEHKAPLTAAQKAANKPPAPQVPDEPQTAVPPLRSVQ